jgi:murein DD-endopeptidase MepM/ murein hydrolase activator NlpD
MSRHRLKARDKRTLKNSRDGLVERNLLSGEDAKATDREAEQDLRGVKPEQARFSQVGKSSKSVTQPSHKHNQQRHYRQQRSETADNTQKSVESARIAPQADTGASTQPKSVIVPSDESRTDDNPQTRPQENTERILRRPPKSKPPPNRKKQYRLNSERKAAKPVTPQSPQETRKSAAEPYSGDMPQASETPQGLQDTPKSALRTDSESGLNFDRTDPAQMEPKQRSRQRPQAAAPDTANAGVPADNAPAATPVQAKPRAKTPRPAKPALKNQRESPLRQSKPGKFYIAESGSAAAATTAKPKQHSQTAKPPEIQQSEMAQSVEPRPETARQSQPIPQESASPTPPGRQNPGNPQLTRDETAQPVPSRAGAKQTRGLGKAQAQADKAGAKLDAAKSKLPAKKKLRSERVFSQESGKAKRRLYFENEVKPQAEHIKGATPLRPVKAAGNLAIAHAHRKIYQVERENVGTEAWHKGEVLAEGGIRSALRFSKTAPYRRVEKLERAAAKKSVNLAYQKALAENPKLRSNILSRAFQKRKIKKDYAKAAREAKKNAERVKKAGSAVSESAKAVAGAIKRHPVAASAIALAALLMFALMSLIGAFGGAGSGAFGGILSASYLAEDADINGAELAYTEWETGLQTQIADVESAYPGYDEYRRNVGEISHSPYELMAYLTVKYENFTCVGIEADLRALFAGQYSLTFTPSTETRYADPTDSDDDGDYEPYDWNVMTITLTARNFSEVTASRLNGGQAAHYALLLQTKGSRQYLASHFDFSWLPYVTSHYGYRVHPISGETDIHRGVDIGAAAGTPIKSGQDGAVTFAGYSGDYGNVVVIENADGLVSKYAHCDTIDVAAGQTVSAGDVIGTVGSTGNSTGAHLHLEIMKDGEYLNPAFFCDSGAFSLAPEYGFADEPMGDGSYAALMEAALRFEGWPYVWGGSSPETSFDCSGLVSYCLRAGGVRDVGRLGAWGLYNICVPVSPSEARPGDLIFFHSTYSGLNPVTHVGIFCGGNLMYDAGNPIGYTRIDTAYWQQHFFAFGRVN